MPPSKSTSPLKTLGGNQPGTAQLGCIHRPSQKHQGNIQFNILGNWWCSIKKNYPKLNELQQPNVSWLSALTLHFGVGVVLDVCICFGRSVRVVFLSNHKLRQNCVRVSSLDDGCQMQMGGRKWGCLCGWTDYPWYSQSRHEDLQVPLSELHCFSLSTIYWCAVPIRSKARKHCFDVLWYLVALFSLSSSSPQNHCDFLMCLMPAWCRQTPSQELTVNQAPRHILYRCIMHTLYVWIWCTWKETKQ